MDKVVCQASPGGPALKVIHLLRSHDLSPRVLNASDTLPLQTLANLPGQVVLIGVPAEEYSRALDVIRVWEAQSAVLVQRTTAELWRDLWVAFGLCCLGVALWSGARLALGAHFTADDVAIAALVIFVGTGVGAIVRGNLRKASNRRRLVGGPRCPVCDYSLIGLTVPRCPECGHMFDPSLEKRAARLDE